MGSTRNQRQMVHAGGSVLRLAVAVGLAGVAWLPWPAGAGPSEGCSEAGVRASNAGDLGAALRAFEAASARPECGDDPFLALNVARARPGRS